MIRSGTAALALGVSLSFACLPPLALGQPDAGQTDAGPIDGGNWINATGNLAGLNSECGNMSLLSSRPEKDQIIAGVAQRGLWTIANGADTWTQLGQGGGSAIVTNRPSAIVYDPGHPDTFWESGIYNGGGVYRTQDSGITVVQLGSAIHSDLVSIDFSDPARRTLLAGTHEQSGKLLRSTDGGSTWIDIGAQLPAGAGYSVSPLVIDAQTHLLGTYSTAGSGVFRTTNGGTSWTQTYSGGVFGHPLTASDGSIYWLLDGGGGLIRSATDKGISWTKMIGSGTLGASVAGVLELPDGRLSTVGSNYVLVSSDHGATWGQRGAPLPYAPVGLIYSRFRKAFYIWHFDCTFDPSGDPVPADAIERLPFDWQTQ